MSKPQIITLSSFDPSYKFKAYKFNPETIDKDNIPYSKGGIFIAARAVDPKITVALLGAGQTKDFDAILINKDLLVSIKALSPSYLLFYESDDVMACSKAVDSLISCNPGIVRLSTRFYNT